MGTYRDGDFVAIDTETTGIICSRDALLEVGAVRFRGWVPVDEYDQLVDPKIPIPAYITRINGIDDSMVAGQPEFYQIIDDLMAFIGADSIVGHNLNFDLNFLASHGAPIKDIPNHKIDTLTMARRKLGRGVDVEDHKLCTLCEHFGIVNEQEHRAATDAKATGLLLKKLAKR